MASKSGEWELSKENVQPLRHGRQMESLKCALDEDDEKLDALRQIQRNFELELRVYSGDDPLEVWYRYIPWIEQNFPKGGSEGNLFQIVHKCCVNFSKDSRYLNDERFLDIWLKCINMSSDPFALYQFMYSNNVCTQLAKFYVSWALELEECGDTAKADGIYLEGIHRKAQPIEMLQTKQRTFLARMTTERVPESWQTDTDVQDEAQREALSVLPVGRKGKVAFNRVAYAQSDVPKIIPSSGNIPSTNSNIRSRQIFHDENNPTVFPLQSSDKVELSAVAGNFKENERKAKKWTKSKLNVNCVTNNVAMPSFVIHQEDCQIPQKFSEKLNNMWNPPLSEKKMENPEMFKFPSEDNPKIEIKYCKEKLFCGGQEFSFEELRAYRWLYRAKSSIEKPKLILNEETKKDTAVSKKLFTGVANEQTEKILSTSVERSLENCFQPLQNTPNTNTESSFHISHPNPVCNEKAVDHQASFELPANPSHKNRSVHLTSPTINTKEAFSAMMNLFNKSLNVSSNDESDSFNEPEVKQSEDVPFTIFTDAPAQNEPEVKQSEDVPFTIFTDTPAQNAILTSDVNTTFSKHSNNAKSNIIASTDHKDLLDAKEKSQLEKSILKCQENCTTAQKKLDQNHVDNFNMSTCGYQLADVTDFTIIPPVNSIAFAEMAKNVSTPLNFSNGTHCSVISENLSNNDSKKIPEEINHDIDPFDYNLRNKLLQNISPPFYERSGIIKVKTLLPSIKIDNTCKLGTENYEITHKLTGGFASLYKANLINNEKTTLALKVQQPACEWEYYITSELKERLKSFADEVDVSNSIVDFDPAYFFKNASVLVNKWSKTGTLLDAINVYKLQNSTMAEVMVLYFSVELMRTMRQMHKCNIIHGDLKPDNILLSNLNDLSVNKFVKRWESVFQKTTKSVTLIDFGQAIDMKLFPLETKFTQTVQTEDFVCPQMLDKRPWSYEIDYYGLLATIHCMLFGTYISIEKEDNQWVQKSRFKRYWHVEMWQDFYREWLNISSCKELPNLDDWLKKFQESFYKSQKKHDLAYQMHTLKVSLMDT